MSTEVELFSITADAGGGALVASLVVLLAAAVIASMSPAERAARVDVTEALRPE